MAIIRIEKIQKLLLNDGTKVLSLSIGENETQSFPLGNMLLTLVRYPFTLWNLVI